MSEYRFTTSIQLAIDWVCRHLLYGDDAPLDYPKPKMVNIEWFNSIEQGEIVSTQRADGPEHDLSREVRFLIRHEVVAIVYLDGIRYSTSRGNTRTMWCVSDVMYKKVWGTGMTANHDVHHVHCEPSVLTDAPLNEPE